MERDEGRLDLAPLRPPAERVDRAVAGALARIRDRESRPVWDAAATELARWWVPALVAAALALVALRPEPPRALPLPGAGAGAAARLGPVIGVPVQVAQWASAPLPPPTSDMIGQLGLAMRAP